LLIADIVPEVWVPPPPVREWRALISFRRRLTKQLTMSKNRLHSVVQRGNLRPPEGGLLAEKNRAWWAAQDFSELTEFQIQGDVEIVAHLERQKAAVDQKLAELSNTEPWAAEMVYLMQIPGFGLIFSMTVLAAIGDIRRFAHSKQLVGYAGLGAGVHASGEKHQDKPITKAGRKELRWALVEAAWVAVRSDPYWKAHFQRLESRMHRNQAIVAIARRLLVSVWHILIKREPYRHFAEETLAYKMLTWAWSLDEIARQGLTRAQFAKYGLLRLGIGQELERIERGGYLRRLAPAAEVLALKPELTPPR
jgi:transposase